MNKTKTSLILILAGTVTFTIALWLYSTKAPITGFEITTAAFVLVVVVFSLIIGTKRLKDAKQGIPPEDELSMKIKQKAAATAFIVSIWMWTMIIIFMGNKEIKPTIPIGLGLIGSGLIFIILWIYYSKKGIGNGNTN